MEALTTWWPVIGTAINLGVLWIAWTIRQVGEAQLRDATADLREVIGGHDTRLTRLERDLEHMPDHDDVAELSSVLAEVRGEVRELGADVRGLRQSQASLAAQVTRIEDWLLDASKRTRP